MAGQSTGEGFRARGCRGKESKRRSRREWVRRRREQGRAHRSLVGAATGDEEVEEQAAEGTGSSGLVHCNNCLEGRRIEKCESGKQVVSATDTFLLTEMQEEKGFWQRRAPHLQLKFESVVCQEQGTSIAHQGHEDAGAAQGGEGSDRGQQQAEDLSAHFAKLGEEAGAADGVAELFDTAGAADTGGQGAHQAAVFREEFQDAGAAGSECVAHFDTSSEGALLRTGVSQCPVGGITPTQSGGRTNPMEGCDENRTVGRWLVEYWWLWLWCVWSLHETASAPSACTHSPNGLGNSSIVKCTEVVSMSCSQWRSRMSGERRSLMSGMDVRKFFTLSSSPL